jgi:hypothetical protein
MQTTNTTTTQSNIDSLEKRDATIEVRLIDIVNVGRKSDRVVYSFNLAGNENTVYRKRREIQ